MILSTNSFEFLLSDCKSCLCMYYKIVGSIKFEFERLIKMDYSNKSELIFNLDKLYTADLGIVRIKRNLSLDVNDVVNWCREKMQDPNTFIVKTGKIGMLI
jgi:hypothetical protein